MTPSSLLNFVAYCLACQYCHGLVSHRWVGGSDMRDQSSISCHASACDRFLCPEVLSAAPWQSSCGIPPCDPLYDPPQRHTAYTAPVARVRSKVHDHSKWFARLVSCVPQSPENVWSQAGRSICSLTSEASHYMMRTILTIMMWRISLEPQWDSP